jgi:hypothetical protein
VKDLKNNLGCITFIIGVILIIGCYIGFNKWKTNRWHKLAIESVDKEVYDVYWDKPYAVIVVDKHFIGKLDENIYFAHTVAVSNDENAKTMNGLTILDIKAKKTSFIENEQDVNNIDITKLDWRKYFETENQLEIYLKSRVKTYKMQNVFGQEVDVTNAICTGQYSIKKELDGKHKGIIMELTNNNPKKLTNEQINIVNVELKKHLSKQNINTYIDLKASDIIYDYTAVGVDFEDVYYVIVNGDKINISINDDKVHF